MNILIISTYGGFLTSFEIDNIKLWISKGNKVFLMSNFSDLNYNKEPEKLNGLDVKVINSDFTRSFKNTKIRKTIKEIRKVIKENNINILECHNPIVSALARIAANKEKVKKIIYTVHGFFFYKGCSFKRKLIYRSIENHLAKKTDVIITTNIEDYEYSKNMKVKDKTFYVHGVGVDVDSIDKLEVDKELVRQECGVSKDDFLMASVGECIDRKNHEIIIKALSRIRNNKLKYVLIGDGEKFEYLKSLAKELQVSDRVIFLGYRKDANRIIKACDLYVFPSKQEGLSVALMQAMAVGLPVVCSRIRGNIDCIDDGKGGHTFDLNDEKELDNSILACINNKDLLVKYGKYNQIKVKSFSKQNVLLEMSKIYDYVLMR